MPSFVKVCVVSVQAGGNKGNRRHHWQESQWCIKIDLLSSTIDKSFDSHHQVEKGDKKFEIVQDGKTHKLIVKDALRDEAGPVKAVSRGVETTGTLTVTGQCGVFFLHADGLL